MDLSKTHFRAMMFYDFKKGLNFTDCHQNLIKAFADDAPSIHTVRRWFIEFKRGRHSLEDDHRSGRPADAVTPANIRLVAELIKEKRNLTFNEIQQALGIGASAVNSILHDHLGVRKVASRWIPHLLSDDQKKARVDWCKFMMKKFDNGRSSLLWNVVTGDETWIYSYDPATKQQSTVWMFEDEVPPTKVVRSKSTSKQMVAVFFRIRGPVAAVPLVERRTVNAQWYTEICLPAVFDQLRQQRPKKGLRGILLHHDNASAHTSALTLDFLHQNGVQLVPHPPYSPDLAPCDFYLFPKLKKELREKNFASANEAVMKMNDILNDLSKEDFYDCFHKWFSRMDKCIKAKGCYFEKL